LRNNGSLDQFAYDFTIGHARSSPIGGVTSGSESAETRAAPEAQDRRSSRKGGGTRYLQATMTISRSNDVDKRREDGEAVTIIIGTFNIRNGRAGNLESALRLMGKMYVDIVLFTETKLTGGRHTKESFGYKVVATEAISKYQGGVALFYHQSALWQVESIKQFGSNLISFQLVTGCQQISCVGGYIPPYQYVDDEFCQ
jgi:hypothetical protein